jgi:hypothetical protein
LNLPPEGFQSNAPLDLHVLGTPPAFILSQDQTLQQNLKLIDALFGFQGAMPVPPGECHYSMGPNPCQPSKGLDEPVFITLELVFFSQGDGSRRLITPVSEKLRLPWDLSREEYAP